MLNYDYSPLHYRLMHAMVQPALETEWASEAGEVIIPCFVKVNPEEHTRPARARAPRLSLNTINIICT